MNNDEEKIDTEYFNFLPQWIYFGVRYSAPASMAWDIIFWLQTLVRVLISIISSNI